MEPDSSKLDNWLGVEVRHLAALEAVAREGSFGRAAESLGYTQSAISQQIQTLERIVGERLLERPGGPRAVSLTEAGVLLLRHAEAIVARLHAAQADMAALAQGQTGALRVGTFQSVGAKVLPEVMRRFLDAWPRVELELTESPSDDELLRLIERGELDLAFAMLPALDGPFETVELLRDPYVLRRPSRRRARRSRAREPRRPRRPDVDRRTVPAGARHWPKASSSSVVSASTSRSARTTTAPCRGSSAAGFGAALVPLLTVDRGDERVSVLELEPEIPRAPRSPSRGTATATARRRRGPSPSSRARSAPRSRPRSQPCAALSRKKSLSRSSGEEHDDAASSHRSRGAPRHRVRRRRRPARARRAAASPARLAARQGVRPAR